MLDTGQGGVDSLLVDSFSGAISSRVATSVRWAPLCEVGSKAPHACLVGPGQSQAPSQATTVFYTPLACPSPLLSSSSRRHLRLTLRCASELSLCDEGAALTPSQYLRLPARLYPPRPIVAE